MPVRGSLEEEYFDITPEQYILLTDENKKLKQELSAIQTKYDKLSVMFQTQFWDIDIMNK